MPTYRADIEYEGTRYRGWQVQQNARTVAGELQRAIAAAGGRLRELGGSGRTDAGVHALGQTAHMRLEREVDAERIRAAINEELPADIHVSSLLRAHDRFHARHDAVSRTYLYQIARRRTALGKRFVWWVRQPLDVGRVAAAADTLTGRHDFRWFCEAPTQQASTVVLVDSVQVAEAGDLLLVRTTASHFLWKMVRRVVGTLVRVGTGEIQPAELAAWLEPRAADDPGVARWTAPPSGLFLERVAYPGEPPPGPLRPAVPVEAPRVAPGEVWLGPAGPRRADRSRAGTGARSAKRGAPRRRTARRRG